MNRLIEDKRYDDAVKVFEFSMKRGFKTANGRTYPTDVIMLAIEGLYRQNTSASLAKAKELLAKVMEHDVDVNPRTASMTSLLAIQQVTREQRVRETGALLASIRVNRRLPCKSWTPFECKICRRYKIFEYESELADTPRSIFVGYLLC